jgi:hypothetical protein
VFGAKEGVRRSDVRIITVHKIDTLGTCVMEDADDDDDAGPAARVDREDELVSRRIRMSFNLCPICWMPLAMDSRDPSCVIDRKWEDVGVTFKGKPAFSIKHPGKARSLARHVFAFGTMSIAPSKSNFQKCHFVHYSMVGNHDRLVNFWKLHDQSEAIGSKTPVAIDAEEFKDIRTRVEVSGAFEEEFRKFFTLVCVERGVFVDALSETSAMCLLVNDPSVSLNYLRINRLVDRIKDFFVGCCDCNASMTISEYVQSVFVLIFFPSVYDSRLTPARKNRRVSAFKRMKVENMIHYIMLSGILYTDDLSSEDGVHVFFKVNLRTRRATWQLRYVLVWCALQILMALWKFNSMDNLIAHHKNYIFLAVADFYYSLMLFALHEGFMKSKESDSGITFESFNFFYSSHMVFYRQSHISNLSMLILGIHDIQQCKVRYSIPEFDDTAIAMTTIKRQLGDIMGRAATFWTAEFLKVSLLINQEPTDPAVRRFFISVDRIIGFNRTLQRVPLNVQTFADALHPTWYWYHFKYITMPSIARLCKLYEHEIVPNRQGQIQDRRPFSSQGVRVWKQWYKLFEQNVNALGARAGSGQNLSVRVLLSACNELRLKDA